MPHSANSSPKALSHPRAFVRSLVASLGLVTLYWIFDGWLHAFLSRDASFSSHLLLPSTEDLVPRLFVSAALVLVIGLLAILRNEERKLRASEEQTRLLLESTGEGIIGVDLDGHCTFVNPATLQLLGYSEASELLGNPLHPILHHTHRDGSFYPTEDCLGCRAYQQGKSIRVDDELYFRKDGSSFEVEYRVYPMRHMDRLVGAVYVFSDVSVRKKAERDLTANTEQLKEANRLKDLFTDILRHDLMNPASSIKASAELLKRVEKDPHKLSVVERIAKSTESLISQCESAAKYARVTQATDLVFAEENIQSLVKRMGQDFEAQLKAKGMILDESLVGECRAEVNPMLVDVFANLVSNAIKYSPEGTRIGLAVRDLGNSCRISVSDQGEGISDQNKERVFTRFERVGKEGVKGSGLGLAIAKQLVQIHRGRIWVEDNPGGGSVFIVEIPKNSSQPYRHNGNK